VCTPKHYVALFPFNSAEEAARYIEMYKIYENKPPEALQGQTSTDYLSKVCIRETIELFPLVITIPPPRPDFGGNSGGGGKNLGEVERSSSRPPWKVRA
jgi:hypothetical protein